MSLNSVEGKKAVVNKSTFFFTVKLVSGAARGMVTIDRGGQSTPRQKMISRLLICRRCMLQRTFEIFTVSADTISEK